MPLNIEVQPLQGGDLHLWLVDPPSLDGLSSSTRGLLAPQELDRAGQFREPELARNFLGRRCALRLLLGSYAGLRPGELEFQRLPGGKPQLTGPLAGPRFSVSASGGWMLAAFCLEEVGVDLELVRPDLAFQALAGRYFGETELAWLEAQQGAEAGLEAFFKAWTRKESLLKLRGLGLAGLQAFRDPAAVGSVWLEDLDLPDPLAGCVALERAPAWLRLRRWDYSAPEAPENAAQPSDTVPAVLATGGDLYGGRAR